MTTHILISHFHEERGLALAWKELLRRLSSGQIDAWFSSDTQPDGGQPAGLPWEDEVYRRLKEADYVLAILTPDSLGRPWIWWECGAATGLERTGKLVPVVYSMSLDQLPLPASRYSGVVGNDRAAVTTWCHRILTEAGLDGDPQFWGPMLDAFDAQVAAALAAPKPLRADQRLSEPRDAGLGVLVDHGHGQQRWNLQATTKPSILEVDNLRTRLKHPSTAQIDVLTIESEAQLNPWALRAWAGLVFAMPFESKLSDKGRDIIVDWVHEGGRLLLLGYELGDRHHDGNLNELAYRFGLHFESTIVAPATWKSSGRPYGTEVTFPIDKAAHPVLDGLGQVTLINVQTIRGEPGSVPVMSVGANQVLHPAHPPERVQYNDRGRWFLNPPETMEVLAPSATRGVLVEAPRDLTVNGRVVGLGSWKFASGAESDAFVRNLTRWLVDRA